MPIHKREKRDCTGGGFGFEERRSGLSSKSIKSVKMCGESTGRKRMRRKRDDDFIPVIIRSESADAHTPCRAVLEPGAPTSLDV